MGSVKKNYESLFLICLGRLTIVISIAHTMVVDAFWNSHKAIEALYIANNRSFSKVNTLNRPCETLRFGHDD